MTYYTNESPFDPKWEMSPEQIAAVFARKNEEDIKGPEGEAVPELTSENNVDLVDIANSQDQFHKLLLTQNYLALLTSIQSCLNKLYKDCDTSTAEVDKEFLDNVTALKGIRANATSLYNLAMESQANEDVMYAKDTFIDIAKAYH